MSSKLKLEKKRFGSAKVIEFEGMLNKDSNWLCVCDCGRAFFARGRLLNYGLINSCGCRVNGEVGKRNKTAVRELHGHAGAVGEQQILSPTYNSWRNMKQRCLDPNHDHFGYYGEKGITVCQRWLESFKNFLSDMGERPVNMTLHRINHSDNYKPENCKWAQR